MSERAYRDDTMKHDAPTQASDERTRQPAPPAAPGARRGVAWPALWPLLRAALIIEAFLLAAAVVAPLGGVTQTISPLARAWPWLLAPTRALFGDALVDGSVPGARGWPELALFAVLLVGASCAAAWALLLARRMEASGASGASDAELRDADDHAGAGIAARRNPRWLLWVALGVTALLGLTLVLSPALPSDDVFSYILYGRISAVHHANPLVTTPAAFTGDPFLPLVFWRNTRSVYGPVWLLLSGGLSLLAQALGGSLVVYVALFKLLGLLAHLANALLIWRILGRLAPRRQLSGTLFYAWNPLCLVEFCASAHNDAVMLTLLLLGVYCLLRATSGAHTQPASGSSAWSDARSGVRLAWEVAALVAFGLSIATKYVPLILAPFMFVAIAAWLAMRFMYSPGVGAKARLSAGGVSGRRVAWDVVWRVVGGVGWRVGVVGLTLLVTALPYWAGAQTLGVLLYSPPAQQLDNSLLESVSWPLRWLAQGVGLTVGQARTVVETSLKVGALIVFGLLWLWSFRFVLPCDLWLRSAAASATPLSSADDAIGATAKAKRRSQQRRRSQGAIVGKRPSDTSVSAVDARKAAVTSWQVVPGMLLAWGWVLLWYSLVASGWFWPWYVAWVVAVAALAPWGRLSVVTLLLAGSALTLYAFLPLQSSFVYGYRSILVFGPAWGYLLWSAWRTRAHWGPALRATGSLAVRRVIARAPRGWITAPRISKVSRETSASSGAK